MCTLVFGLDVIGPGTVVLAANRDEDPARGSEGPQVLRDAPRVVGGRDAVAGGTWLALRGGASGREPGVALLLNRRDPEHGRTDRRSRGLLTLETAAADDPLAFAQAEVARHAYAPCSLVWLTPSASWLLALRHGEAPTLARIAPGWHALSHHELDDPHDARTAWLVAQLAGFAPASRADAEARLAALIATHGDAQRPGVCLHGGRAPTVSASMVWLARGEAAYRHAAGPPCVTPFADASALLIAPSC